MNAGDRSWALTGVAVLAVAALHVAGFGGWWLSDDLANLQQFFADDQQDRLLAGSLATFSGSLSPSASLYRPLSIVSLSANYLVSGAWYPGWYASNLGVHLVNTWLVMRLATRLGRAAGSGTRSWQAPALAGALFGLAPALCEGVYWISARADGWVTLLCLLAALAWCDAGDGRRLRAFAVPALLLLALLFKESAAVLPLQLALLAVAWPQRTQGGQRIALGAAFVLLALFLVLRWWMFGNVWQAYMPPDAAPLALGADSVIAALSSFGPWWSALTAATPRTAVAYPLTLAAALLCTLWATDAAGRRLALACGAAAVGMMLAAVLNLVGMPPDGEGGRLTYTPMAWLAVGLGAALARAPAGSMRQVSMAAILLAVATGALTAHGVLTQARAAQDGLRDLAAALPAWAAVHEGATLVVAPVRVGPVVFALNAQAGIALQPVQAQGLLNRTLVALPDELAMRHAQFGLGVLTRLEAERPQWLDTPRMLALSAPAAPAWPRHFACWAPGAGTLRSLPAPPQDDALAWRDALRAAMRDRCGY